MQRVLRARLGARRDIVSVCSSAIASSKVAGWPQLRRPPPCSCGHLFCWPCLYRWLNSGHDQCPVCKSTVTDETIIPLYGRDAAR